jgi:carboxyl-terminal processing protease
MKRILLWLAFAWTVAAQAATLDAATPYPAELKPQRQEAQAAHLAAELLSRYHYKGMPLNEGLSTRIFDAYLKSLDAEKLIFLQSDVDRFSADRARLGDAILKEDLTVPFAIFNVYTRRAAERFTYARGLLKKRFDFAQDESYQTTRAKESAWPQTQPEIDDLWRKRVKNDWLRLRLAGKDEKSIADILDKRYDNFLKRIGRIKSAEAFQTFMNAYTMAIEPHTNYMGPRAAAEFDISMRLSLVGIGAVLADVDEYVTIRELVPGGPATLSGQLKIGDRIVGVAQGDSGALTDILGWRPEDAVELIRGTADSVVVLDVLPADAGPDGKHKRVSLVRKTISLQEQAAKATVRTTGTGNSTRRVGVITLPSFYEDFAARQRGDTDYKSASRDVARLLEQLKKEKVDSVLMDLRNNGGGSLVEAVELTGLFIDKGPVVQQRNASGAITVESDNVAGAAWSGPLGVLINRGSASASEIFAAAIQDYGRGLIIGEPSFGKGTVQTIVNLDQIAKTGKPQLGELKMTVAQFFRVDGGTTQLRGVKPDIAFPAVSDDESFGESSFENALPWTQIKAAQYAPAGDLKQRLPALVSLHDARVRNDRDFKYLQEDSAELKALRKKKLISLNEAERRKERDAQEARLASREAANDPGQAAVQSVAIVRDDGLQADERNLSNALAAEKARKNAKDVFLNEAVNILGDEVGVLKGGGRITAQAGQQARPIAD